MPRRCIAKLWNPSSQDTASTEVSVGPETDLTNLQTKKCLRVVVKNKVTTSEQRLLLTAEYALGLPIDALLA